MSFQITLTPSRRAAGRFVARVRRELQKAYTEEKARRGLSQSDIAREIGVHRSVISREMRGFANLTLSRVGELAFAMGRKPIFELLEPVVITGSNAGLPAQSSTSEPSSAAFTGIKIESTTTGIV